MHVYTCIHLGHPSYCGTLIIVSLNVRSCVPIAITFLGNCKCSSFSSQFDSFRYLQLICTAGGIKCDGVGHTQTLPDSEGVYSARGGQLTEVQVWTVVSGTLF